MYAEGQNLARLLMEGPANHITPTTFANIIEEKMQPHTVTIHKRFGVFMLTGGYNSECIITET